MTRHPRPRLLAPPPILLVALLLLSGCPALSTVTGPDGEPLADDECLLTVDADASCTGCDGFERWEVGIEDAAAETWSFDLAPGEDWVAVVASGTFRVDYTALLFGAPYVYGPEEFVCDRVYDLSLGCEGFDFCGD